MFFGKLARNRHWYVVTPRDLVYVRARRWLERRAVGEGYFVPSVPVFALLLGTRWRWDTVAMGVRRPREPNILYD